MASWPEVPGFDFTQVDMAPLSKVHQSIVTKVINQVQLLGRCPTAAELKIHQGITSGQVHYHFKTYEALLRLSGYRPDRSRRRRGPLTYNSVTREDVIEVFQQFARVHGCTPTDSLIARLHKDGKIPFGPAVARRLFNGSHSNAVVEAGLTPNQGRPIRFTKETAAQAILAWARVHGVPKFSDYESSPELPAVERVITLFDGLDNALLELGFNPHSGRLYSEEDLVEKLRQFRRRHGRRPKHHEYGRDGLPHRFTYETRFNGHTAEALRLAGI